MSDFISRQAVAELIESKCVDRVSGTEDTALIDADELLDDVLNIPAAYDPDRVIERISELNDNEFTLSVVAAIIRAGGAYE